MVPIHRHNYLALFRQYNFIEIENDLFDFTCQDSILHEMRIIPQQLFEKTVVSHIGWIERISMTGGLLEIPEDYRLDLEKTLGT